MDLADRAELHGAVLAHLPVGLWVARAPSGEAVYANQAFNEILGMDAVTGVDISGAPATYGIYDRRGNLYPTERLPFSRALQEGKPVQVDDLVIHRSDGRRVYVRAFARPLRDRQGQVAYVIVAFIDITAEAEAIAERQQAEARLTFALDHAPVILYALDADGRITLAKGAGLPAVGMSEQQLLGRSAFETYPEDSPVARSLRRALAGETVVDTLAVDDTYFDTFMAPICAPDGSVTGAIGMSTNVTEQRRLQRQAIQNDRIMAMGTLAASVAHEINNPLSYILGNLAEIERALDGMKAAERALASVGGQAPSPEVGALLQGLAAVRSSAAAIRVGADRVRHVTQDLRSFSRPDDETVSAVALGAVVNAVLDLVRKEIEARARLVVELSETPAVRGNEARLVQVVLNLLVNAWQALGDGDPARHEIRVRTFTEERNNGGGPSGGARAAVEVSDSGPGIPAGVRDRVFEPFFTTKEVGQGTGLGLFVCRNIVTAFGGEIQVGERPGGGTVFTVLLPAAVEAKGRKLTPPIGQLPVVPERRPRILIIDDDDWVSRTLVQTLRHDFEVAAERDAGRAIQVILAELPRGGFDLVFCDLVMNQVTGMDVYERLQTAAPTMLPRLVFMTGGAFTAEAAAFAERVPEAMVYKPFDILAEARRRLGLPV